MRTILSFISLLKLELIVVLYNFSRNFKTSSLDMLIQDKLCRIRYNQSFEFCRDLSSIEQDDPNYRYKTLILADAVNYNTYHNLITMVPTIVLPLFYGPWTDRYIKAKKIIILISCVAICIETFMETLNSFYFDIGQFTIP